MRITAIGPACLTLGLALLSAATLRADSDLPDLAPEARALVERWLAAQNKGDFAAYQSLYADRFTGVRRSGPRTVRLDHAGWLKDRARMFKKPMVVAIEDVKVQSTPVSAQVLFTQRFKQGSYEDAGPKQLVVVREGGQVRIAREEMLRSDVVAGAPGASSEAEKLAFVIDEGVIITTEVRDGWGRGPRSVTLGDPVVVTQAVDPAKLPPALSAWAGRAVKLVTESGGSCDATVTALKLVGRVTPHFGTRQEWQDKKRRAAADEAWSMAAAGGLTLVGELSAKCKGAVLARAASLPPLVVATPTAPDAALSKSALAAFRALKPWAALQAAWKSDGAGKKGGRWDEQDGGPAVKAWKIAKGGATRTFVSVSAIVQGGCAKWDGDLWGLFEVDGGGKLLLRNDPGQITVEPTLAVDSDGDGAPELLFQRTPDFSTQGGLVRPATGVWRDVLRIKVPYLDCPC